MKEKKALLKLNELIIRTGKRTTVNTLTLLVCQDLSIKLKLLCRLNLVGLREFGSHGVAFEHESTFDECEASN